MELYCFVGGEANSLKRWQEDLSAQFLPTYDKVGKRKILGETEEGKPIHAYRRLLVAPIQLYKIAFAEEELDKVLSMVCPTDYIENRYKPFKYAIKFFRKLLGLKSPSKPKFLNPLLQPNQIDKAVFVVPIGLKKDARDIKGEEVI